MVPQNLIKNELLSRTCLLLEEIMQALKSTPHII